MGEGKGRAGKRATVEAGAGATRPNDREGRGEKNKFLFIFLNTIFKSKFNSNLYPFEVLIKPNHHKINMQQHVCTTMLLDLIVDVNLTKNIIFLGLHAHKMYN